MTADQSDDTVITFERRSRFKRERFLDIRHSTRPWRVKNAWPMQGLSFVVGASGAAKTFFVVDGLLRIACGASKVWGRKAKQCGVVLVAAEDPEGCRVRVEGWKRSKQRASDTQFQMIGRAPNLLDQDEVDELKAELRLAAEEMAAADQPLGIAVFDTLQCCIAGADENSGVDMARVLAVLQELARELDILVVVVAHFGKSGSERGIRGWSGLGANADGIIELERDKDDPELRRVRFGKVKNGRDGGELAFRLEEVVVGTDDDGEEISTCVPAFEVAAPAAKKRRKKALTAPQQIVLQAIKFVTDHGATLVLPVTTPGAKPWMKGVSTEDVKARAMASGLSEEGEKRNTTNVRFNRALEAVCGAEYARMEGGVVWLI